MVDLVLLLYEKKGTPLLLKASKSLVKGEYGKWGFSQDNENKY